MVLSLHLLKIIQIQILHMLAWISTITQVLHAHQKDLSLRRPLLTNTVHDRLLRRQATYERLLKYQTSQNAFKQIYASFNIDSGTAQETFRAIVQEIYMYIKGVFNQHRDVLAINVWFKW